MKLKRTISNPGTSNFPAAYTNSDWKINWLLITLSRLELILELYFYIKSFTDLQYQTIK